MPKAATTIFPNDTALGRAAAHEIFDDIQRAYQLGKVYVLGCPGGRSPRSTYQALATLVSTSRQPLNHLFIAMMDEYVMQSPAGAFHNVDEGRHYSCRGFAFREIHDLLNQDLEGSQQIPLNHVLGPEAKSPAEYEALLRELGVDCFLLASGATDGHVAFNGRGTARESVTRVTQLSEETRRDNMGTFPEFRSLSEVPEFGVTVGPETIAAVSRKTIMLLQGDHKREAFQRITSADNYDTDWPATIISECAAPKVFADAASSI